MKEIAVESVTTVTYLEPKFQPKQYIVQLFNGHRLVNAWRDVGRVYKTRRGAGGLAKDLQFGKGGVPPSAFPVRVREFTGIHDQQ